MASSLIHICIAKKINEKLNLDQKQLYLGSIAPDINHWVGISKLKTHFSNEENPDIPNVGEFLKKYHNNLNDPFVLGYFTHLYADKLWYGNFIPSKFEGKKIRLLDGTLTKATKNVWSMSYSDFTSLTRQLIDYFGLDLSLFYEEFNKPNDIIKEIPVEKLSFLIDEISLLVINSPEKKLYLFDIKEVVQFIDECSNNILDILKLKL